MKETVATYLGLITYLTVVAIPVVLFDMESYIAMTLLLGIPAVWLYCKLDASRTFLLIVVGMACAQALLWQVVGHSSGMWYELSVLPWHVFGVVPAESLWEATITFVFMIVAYEYFIDDRYIDSFAWGRRQTILASGLLIATVMAVLYAVFLPKLVLSYAYLWLLLLLLGLVIGSSWLLRGRQLPVLEKVSIGVVVLLPILTIVGVIQIMNTFVVYANPTEYIASMRVMGELVPIERFLEMLVLPFTVLALYEWFVDDND